MKIVIQGHNASFHDVAARQFYGDDIQIVPCDTFAEVFVRIKEGDGGMCAIENSLYGSVHPVYDLLAKHNVWVHGEVILPIRQCLIALPGARVSDITEVHSHPVALAQCDVFLDTHVPNVSRNEHHDTAASVADIKTWADPHKAAIASEAAAQLHGMLVLAKDIETNKENYTRFVALSNERVTPSNANKTLFTLVTDHSPGALFRALQIFAEANINLTKLESRPIIGQPWHYKFYIDVAAGITEPVLSNALKQLSDQGYETTVLGSIAV